MDSGQQNASGKKDTMSNGTFILRELARLCACSMALLSCLQFAIAVSAQEIQMARQRGPYYVGEPMILQVVAKGFQPGQDPICRLQQPAPNGIMVQGPQVGQTSSSMTQIINGRMSQSQSIEYRFSFSVVATRTGQFEVGPFEVLYDGQVKTVSAEVLTFEELENDPDMEIELAIPQQSLFVGQRVPVTIRWAFTGENRDLQYAFGNLQIRSPLFDQFRFVDTQTASRATLNIVTANGGVGIAADVSTEERDGREFVVVTGQRTLVADSPGAFSDIPITCRTKRATRWSRNIFGDLAASADRPALSAGSPVSFEVRPLPLSGRPSGFSGAVGTGFSIGVGASNTVVRVGDPITLEISVSGDGNLESVSLPNLSGAGLSEAHFETPSDQPAGSFDGNVKRFNVNVRVKDKAISQIPPVAFSWFDPVKEKYVTAKSKPIALQVLETQVISAADVVSAQPNAAESKNSMAESNQESSPASGLSFVGANLAIDRNASRLLAGSMATPVLPVSYLLYAAGVLAVVVGFVVARSKRRDRSVSLRRTYASRCRKQIARAAALPQRTAAEQVARSLRLLISDFKPNDRRNVDRLIAECDNIVFSPRGDATNGSSKALSERALEIADQILSAQEIKR